MIKNNEVTMELIGDRRIFSIDVGDMPSDEIEKYLDNIREKVAEQLLLLGLCGNVGMLVCPKSTG